MHIIGRGRWILAATVVMAVALGAWGVPRSGSDSGRDPSPARSATSPGQPEATATQTGAGATEAGWVKRENAKPGSKAWMMKAKKLADDTQLAGYTDHVSVLPGEPVGLYVTTTAPRFTVTAFRLGWYGGDLARRVWDSSSLPGRNQAAPVIGAHRMVTTSWTPSTTIDTIGWPEGTYLLLLTDSRGLMKYVPLTVRSQTVAGRLVLVNAVTTYQAYNAWGGHSLYGGLGNDFGTRSTKVSFDRPYDRNGARILTQYEQPVIAEAERGDLPLAYLTSMELDGDPQALVGARGLVSLGHDEYWTVGMRAAATTARDAGTNLAFLGANSLYWRIRLEPSALGPDRVIVGYKSAVEDPVTNDASTTAKWREDPRPMAENSLLGMLYECFPAHGSLVVTDPGFFLFSSTGARKGASYRGLVGTEIDRAYPVPGTPENLQVVAHSPVICGSNTWTHSDVTYYSTGSGAGVFAVGTMLWSTALRGPNTTSGINIRTVTFARRVTENLFAAMADGPMGAAHPARGNLASLNAPAGSYTGTGGPLAP
jgi:hypothetical protein